MTVAQDVIRRGFREDNLIPIGRSPTIEELAEGLDLLNAFILSVYGSELGENMADWVAPQPQRTAPVAANYPQYPLADDDTNGRVYPYPPSNSRVVWSGEEMTVYMPENPRPGARLAVVQGSGARNPQPVGSVLTLNGNGRRIESAPGVVGDALAMLNPIDPKSWFYRADTGVWCVVQKLALTDPIPFPEDVDDFWICALSIRLAPRYSKTVNPATSARAQAMLGKIKREFRQVTPTTYGSDNFPTALESFPTNARGW